MLKVSFLEFIMRGIPEGLLLFLAAYAFTKNKIQLNRYLISVILLSVIVYLIRLLPIENGADSMLNLIVFITLAIFANGFPVIQSIKVCIVIMLLEFICELVNIFFLQFILGKDLNFLFRDQILKILYNSPSLLIFGCIVIVYYIRLCKRKELKYISYGKVNE
ncbi:hypothetical protein [Clostridium pasteurianum]|uniref:Uncharacterized protein n=1 Tax=Clostridium pasteurianum BC1 TaxID=86416 RepID=R4K758_CLOPA|nr:hypothetical protein [Clostridium pasteurianum]AGK98408.1 hypothetical protein Clopa_3626 [Clostridium pasteurianum BC1]